MACLITVSSWGSKLSSKRKNTFNKNLTCVALLSYRLHDDGLDEVKSSNQRDPYVSESCELRHLIVRPPPLDNNLEWEGSLVWKMQKQVTWKSCWIGWSGELVGGRPRQDPTWKQVRFQGALQVGSKIGQSLRGLSRLETGQVPELTLGYMYHTWELWAGEGRGADPNFRQLEWSSGVMEDVATVIIKVASEVVFKLVTDDIVSEVLKKTTVSNVFRRDLIGFPRPWGCTVYQMDRSEGNISGKCQVWGSLNHSYLSFWLWVEKYHTTPNSSLKEVISLLCMMKMFCAFFCDGWT